MLSHASLRPVRLASSIPKNTNIRSAGVGFVSPSSEPAASSKRGSIAIVTAAASPETLTSTSSSFGGRRRRIIAAAAPKKPAPKKSEKNQQIPVDYGRDWFAATRDPSRGLTPRQEMERRRAANQAANNGLERKDLYTDAWAGSEYRGSSNNIVRAEFAFLVGCGGEGGVGAEAEDFLVEEKERKKLTSLLPHSL